MGVHFNKNLLSIDIGRVENFFKVGTQDKSNCPISTRGIKLLITTKKKKSKNLERMV